MRRLPLVAAALLLVVGGAVVVIGYLRHTSTTGHALTGQGPLMFGQTESIAVAGGGYRFAFPLLANNTGRPVVVTGFSGVSIPHGVTLLGYLVYSLADTDHRYLLGYGDRANHKGQVDLDTILNRAGQPFTIAPHTESQLYAMVHVRADVTPAGAGVALHGCTVNYRVGSRRYHQHFDCKFALQSRAAIQRPGQIG